jgi:hypothetical protein
MAQGISVRKNRPLQEPRKEAGRQAYKGSWAWSIDVPASAANIFSATMNRTKIHNMTGSMRH